MFVFMPSRDQSLLVSFFEGGRERSLGTRLPGQFNWVTGEVTLDCVPRSTGEEAVETHNYLR